MCPRPRRESLVTGAAPPDGVSRARQTGAESWARVTERLRDRGLLSTTLYEWVADWAPNSLTSPNPNVPLFGTGQNCFVGADNTSPGTAALSRGFSGVYDVIGVRDLGSRELGLGFRAVR